MPITAPLPAPLHPARFAARPNRFLVLVRLDESDLLVEAHLPDPGRLRELLIPGARMMVQAALPGVSRRTAWTAVLVEVPGVPPHQVPAWVSLDTTLPNRLIGAALQAGVLPEFGGWTLARREVAVGRSRLDFLLTDGGGRSLYLEVKSVTLVEDDGVARFPDAVTARGARHVDKLRSLVEEGGAEAAVLFVLQREDAHRIEAARSIDPAFAAALERARDAGVRILGRRCTVGLEGVTLGEPIPADVG